MVEVSDWRRKDQQVKLIEIVHLLGIKEALMRLQTKDLVDSS